MEVHQSHSAILRAENAALRAEVELLRDAVDHMHQGLCLFGADRRIALCNANYAKVLQLPPEAVTPGLPVRSIVEHGMQAGYYPAGITIDEIEATLWRHLEEGPATRGIIKRGGRTYAVKPAPTARGNWVATFEDITAQEEAQAALSESEARLHAMLDAMPYCVTIFTDKPVPLYINRQGLELLEAEDAAFLSAPDISVIPKNYLRLCRKMNRRAINGESVVWQHELVSRKGRRCFVETHAVPFILQDGRPGYLCVTRDETERLEAERKLRRSEERLRLVKEATGLADFEAGADGIARISESFVDQTGLPAGTETLTQEDWATIIHPEDRERLLQEIQDALDNSDLFTSEFRIVRPDNGEVRWILSHTKMERDESGFAVNSTGAHLDITRRKRAEEALRDSEERFRLAAEAAGLGVWDYNAASDSRDWSGRLREILGVSFDAKADLEVALARLHPQDREQFHEQLIAIREAADSARFEATLRIEDKTPDRFRWVVVNGWKTRSSRSDHERVIMTFRDVTDERAVEERIRWSASHDPLTGLANRRKFQEQLDTAVREYRNSGTSVGLLLLDVDHFKQINDTLGHDAGDSLLKNIATKLQALVRPEATVARLGGDEFAVVMPRLNGEQELRHLAEAVLDSLREPFAYNGQLLDCRVSIGASICPSLDRAPSELLKNADLALYSAKSAGRSTIRFFKPAMRRELMKRASMIQHARAAAANHDVVPYYQPKLDLRQGKVVGFEALLRWRKPNGKIGTPADIEAAFADLEVAWSLSDRMIQRAFCDVRRWLDQGVAFGHVAINASAAEFRRDAFAERLLHQLQIADIPAHHVQLEVTETVFLGRGAEFVHRALHLLNASGVKIALDDFGTGYASLRHLKQFPVDIIKIDRSFVRDMEDDPGDAAIIRAVINLGRSLGIEVVAEGIEHQSQVNGLVGLGCDQGQGFYFSKAVPARNVPSLVRRFSTS